MTDPGKWRELRWRRPLAADEEAALRAESGPESDDLHDHELENALTRGLNGLSDIPVASNFTSRVLSAVDLESRAQGRSPRAWGFKRLLPRLAFAVSGIFTVTAVVLLITHQQQVEARQLAQSVAAVSGVAALPSPEVLQDFEAIRQLNNTPAPDEQLLALFK